MNEPGVMLQRLAASGPDPAHAEDMKLFGQLTGSWDIEMAAIAPDGQRQRLVAEWHFGWALEGRAVQDVLITRSHDGRVVGFGTTVRCFDPRRGLCWVVWQDPLAGEFSVLLAREDGGRIVLEGRWTIADAFRPFRWTFSDVTLDSFRWECEVLEDNDEWRLVEEMHARRVRSRPWPRSTSSSRGIWGGRTTGSRRPLD